MSTRAPIAPEDRIPFVQKLCFAAGQNTDYVATGLLTSVLWMPFFNIGLGINPLVLGVILELASVWMLLDHRSLELRRYQRAIRSFKIGVVLVGLGVTLAILVDFVAVTEHFSPGSGGTGH